MHSPGLKHHFCIQHNKISLLNACYVLGTLRDGNGTAKQTGMVPALKVFAFSWTQKYQAERAARRGLSQMGWTVCPGSQGSWPREVTFKVAV